MTRRFLGREGDEVVDDDDGDGGRDASHLSVASDEEWDMAMQVMCGFAAAVAWRDRKAFSATCMNISGTLFSLVLLSFRGFPGGGLNREGLAYMGSRNVEETSQP